MATISLGTKSEVASMDDETTSRFRRSAADRTLNTILFWSLLLLSAVLLVPTVLLPPWIQFERKKRELATKTEAVAALQTELEVVRKKNEYRDNPDFLLQLERIELGADPIGAERIQIDPAMRAVAREEIEAMKAPQPAAPDAPPTVAERVQDVFNEYPIAQAYLRPTLRIPLLVMGAGALLLAVWLIAQGDPTRVRKRRK